MLIIVVVVPARKNQPKNEMSMFFKNFDKFRVIWWGQSSWAVMVSPMQDRLNAIGSAPATGILGRTELNRAWDLHVITKYHEQKITLIQR
jgi:hypothetical protein